MTIGLEHYLILSAVLFCIGLYGALVKHNAIVILMCIEIMINSANIAAVAFSQFVTPVEITGQVLVIFTIAVAAAEAAVGMAIIFAIYHNHKSINVNKIDLMKW